MGVWIAYYGLSMQQCKDMGINADKGLGLYAECLRGLVFSPNRLLKPVFEKKNGQINVSMSVPQVLPKF
jgi:NAD(P) transhydrogenase